MRIFDIFWRIFGMFASADKKFKDSVDFVNFCFVAILGRECRDEERSYWIEALDRGILSREKVLIEFLTSKEFRDRQQPNPEFVPAGHFYSAIPSLNERTDFLNQNHVTQSIPGIRLNETAQAELLRKISSLSNEFCFPEFKTDGFRYYWNNPAFTLVDGLVLFGMIRHFRPERIIEIGSGFSSCLMLDINDSFFEGRIQFIFIEPHPDLLYSLIRPDDAFRNTIVPMKIQDADLGLFSSLQGNDILFIDSTHVSKLGSDVNRELFQLLPILQTGAIVHFHDIYWPFENLRQWIEEGRAWNENYIMRAFLQYNDTFEILLFPSYLQQCKRELIATEIPRTTEGTAGSLWLQKTK